MDKTFWVLAAFALAVAGCSPGQDDGAATAPAADAAGPAAGATEAGRTASGEARPDTPMQGGFTPLVNPDGRITQGRCHMDACSWMRWEAVEVVGTDVGEVTLRATILGGVSDHARTDGGSPEYPETADGVAIDWDPEPSVVTFRCSKNEPSVQWGDEPVVLLPLDPGDFVPGAMESLVRSYFAACHGDFEPGPGGDAMVKYEYHVPGRE